jgi:hypothetical protein
MLTYFFQQSIYIWCSSIPGKHLRSHDPGTHDSIILDPPMTLTEKNLVWRKGIFLHTCNTQTTSTHFNIRSFCNACSFLVPQSSIALAIRCPGCNKEESWEHIGFPCLACQYTSIIVQNPFNKCLDMIKTWLPTSSDLESGSDNSNCTQTQTP